MKVKVKNILKQKYLMKHTLEKTREIKLIQFQMKILSITVEYYYKYKIITLIAKKQKY